MQNAKQEELFEEVEVIDDADKEETGSSTENQIIGDTQTTTENQEQMADDEDLSEYSDTVKKRISKLTNRFREEERQRKAALDYAESVKKQNEDLQQRLEKLDTNYVGEFDTRVTAQSAAAKEEYKKALESGDAEALYNAQQNISRIAMEEANLKRIKADREEQAQRKEAAPQKAQPQQVQPRPDPRAERWAQDNSWFGQDQTMTYAAFGIHKTMIEQEGFDPNSEDYYTELDNRIRTEFSHKFSDNKKSNAPRVASAGNNASRSGAKRSRTVKLTPSQIAIAKRLGVPLEEYAKHVKE